MKSSTKKLMGIIGSALLIVAISPSQASAADKGYRYWGYFQAGPKASTWSEAQSGPTLIMKDGSVEGWVFTFASKSVPTAAVPRIKPDFAKICGSTKALPNKKRVAIVIDFGSSLITPTGEKAPVSIAKCVVAEPKALGIDVLGKVAKVRAGASGLICGLNNFPLKECGVQIPTPNGLMLKN